jgi:hydrogenase expression/formation protein HypD
MLVSHVLVPPAMTAILSSPTNRVEGFLAAGHVCTVMGTAQYGPLVDEFGVPIVVTGFEPLDLLEGVRQVVELLEAGRAELRNAYPRAVTDAGNTVAQKALADVFTVTDRQWRGIGEIPASGWTLSDRYAQFDAERKFGVGDLRVTESAECRSGEVLQGLLKPNECPAFGTTCTPRTPLGATMVSSEGACAAYYQFRRLAASV